MSKADQFRSRPFAHRSSLAIPTPGKSIKICCQSQTAALWNAIQAMGFSSHGEVSRPRWLFTRPPALLRGVVRRASGNAAPWSPPRFSRQGWTYVHDTSGHLPFSTVVISHVCASLSTGFCHWILKWHGLRSCWRTRRTGCCRHREHRDCLPLHRDHQRRRPLRPRLAPARGLLRTRGSSSDVSRNKPAVAH